MPKKKLAQIPSYSQSPTDGRPNQGKASGNNEWNTPPELIEAARAVLGTIDLDPASNVSAQQLIQARTYYTKESNGLDKRWTGNVWLNSPYSRGLVDKFAYKFIDHWTAGDIKEAILLFNTANGVQWFDALLTACDCIGLTRKRTRFIGQSGTEAKSPAYGQTFFYFGQHPDRFQSSFTHLAHVFNKR